MEKPQEPLLLKKKTCAFAVAMLHCSEPSLADASEECISWQLIATMLPYRDLASLARVCKAIHAFIKSELDLAHKRVLTLNTLPIESKLVEASGELFHFRVCWQCLHKLEPEYSELCAALEHTSMYIDARQSIDDEILPTTLSVDNARVDLALKALKTVMRG